ncbi:hypothetical protein CISIN_1g036542mg [Citrus sinensis]|uniref:Uncharacterized protein n=1 Tax=Citrus sinensis TaxID=2711 RepID=A0A067FZ42_CITSI|nr:hypothetical protein CISIN_1g036542mg [Citrus sinensis]
MEIWILGLIWTYGFRNFIWDQSASRTNKCSSSFLWPGTCFSSIHLFCSLFL